MNDTITKKSPKVISTEQQFNDWLRESQAGEKVVYHTGYLAADRMEKDFIVNERINSLAAAAWHAYDKGKVTLLQQRDKVNSVIYIAVRLREKAK